MTDLHLAHKTTASDPGDQASDAADPSGRAHEQHERPAEPAAAPAPAQVRRVRIVLLGCLVLVLAGAVALSLPSTQDAAAAKRARPAAAKIPVRVVLAQRQALELNAPYQGELDADAAEIAARISGLLQEVRVRIGDAVRKGEVLARVDTSQLVHQLAEARAQERSARANLQRVRAELEVARSTRDRTEPLLGRKLVSAQEVDALRARVTALEAEAASSDALADQAQARTRLLQQQIRDAQLVAPFSGAVAQRYLDAGAVVQHGTSVVRIVRDGPLRVRFAVPERDLGQLKPGLTFQLTTQATAAEHFAGKVERVAAAIDRQDRSVAVEGVLEAAHPGLRPGMYAQISLQLGVVEAANTLPGAAVLERASGETDALVTGVFVVRREGEADVARFTPVRVVGRAAERVAVEGLPSGARVVSVGHERLRDGTQVLVGGSEDAS